MSQTSSLQPVFLPWKWIGSGGARSCVCTGGLTVRKEELGQGDLDWPQGISTTTSYGAEDLELRLAHKDHFHSPGTQCFSVHIPGEIDLSYFKIYKRCLLRCQLRLLPLLWALTLHPQELLRLSLSGHSWRNLTQELDWANQNIFTTHLEMWVREARFVRITKIEWEGQVWHNIEMELKYEREGDGEGEGRRERVEGEILVKEKSEGELIQCQRRRDGEFPSVTSSQSLTRLGWSSWPWVLWNTFASFHYLSINKIERAVAISNPEINSNWIL